MTNWLLQIFCLNVVGENRTFKILQEIRFEPRQDFNVQRCGAVNHTYMQYFVQLTQHHVLPVRR